MPNFSNVSVIVPTLDSGDSIARCLTSIERQRGVSVETIVVDQGSRDQTVAVARQAGAEVVHLPRPKVYRPPTRSRNAGARISRGRYLLHLDADMELLAGTLAACVEACESQGHVALIIHEIDCAVGFWAACKALERRCYWGVDEVEGARFVRADVFWAVGGYDECLGSGEDWDVHQRYLTQGSVGESPIPLTHHLGRIRLTTQLKKKFTYGRSAQAFLRKGSMGAIGAAMWRAYWKSRRNLVRDPLHAAGLVALRSTELGALVLGTTIDAIARARKRVAPLSGSRAD